MRLRVVLFAALMLAAFTLGVGAKAEAFSDIPSGYAYGDAIQELSSLGIVNGYTDGRFGPDDAVIRQQFAKMVVGTAGYPVSVDDDCPFADVDEQLGTDPLYPSRYVAVAASHGITVGKTATLFDPWANITRYQVITMVVRTADDLAPGTLATPPPGYGTWRADATHGANAARAEYGGLLAGLDLTALNPYGDMPRGEVAQVLYNLLHSPTIAEGRAIRAAIQDSLGDDTRFLMTRLKISGQWAGAVITPLGFVADPLQVLLHKVGGVWNVVDCGTGYEAADWMAQGAPPDLAAWLEGLS